MADYGGLVVEWRAPRPQVARLPDGAVSVTLPGYALLDQPGAPQLPFASALVALPPRADPELEFLALEETTLTLPGPLTSAPAPEGVVRAADGRVVGGGFAPAQMVSFNPEAVELQPVGVVRGVRLARLVFYPVRPAGERYLWVTRVRVALHYNSPDDVTPSQAIMTDPLLSAARSAVVNPEAAQPAPAPAVTDVPKVAAASGAPRAAVEVGLPGLTAVTYEALNSIGFPAASADPQYLHLRRAGADIPFEWEGDGDPAFEPGERLLFYADPRFSRWTATDVYFLAVEGTPGPRMTTRSADPSSLAAGTAWVTQTAEVNALYTPLCYCSAIPLGRDGDAWAWDDLRRAERASRSYNLSLPGVDSNQPGFLTLWLIGYTDIPDVSPDHRVDVSLNGVGLGQVEWDGKQAITATFPISAGVLSAENTLNLSLPGLPGLLVEGMWLDAFSIRYARGTAPVGAAAIFTGESLAQAYTIALSPAAGLRAYDVTEADQPVRLSGLNVTGATITLGDPPGGWPRRYAVTSEGGIQSPARLRLAESIGSLPPVDYLIIAHADFIPALSPLIVHRQSRGLTAAVVDVQAVYDAYDGRPTPDAIRAYLAQAYAAWTPPPTYVLLVGDGTYDPRRYLGDSSATFIPPYLADVDPWAGETAADNRYVTVDGADALPDMLIGRLPVNTLAEAQTVVSKIVQYETDPLPGGWNGKVVFAADDPDTAGDFASESQILASAFITAPFTAQPVYYLPPATTVTETYQSLLSHWAGGAGLVMFTGHSSDVQWAQERLFHLDDAPLLNNGARLPVVAEMTCFTGAFHMAAYPTLDEALLREGDGGAVAVWGATGLGVSTGHMALAEGFMASLYQQNQPGLGAAALAGKLRLAQNSSYLDLLDTYLLFGDPAMPMNLTLVPWPNSLYLPVIQR